MSHGEVGDDVCSQNYLKSFARSLLLAKTHLGHVGTRNQKPDSQVQGVPHWLGRAKMVKFPLGKWAQIGKEGDIYRETASKNKSRLSSHPGQSILDGFLIRAIIIHHSPSPAVRVVFLTSHPDVVILSQILTSKPRERQATATSKASLTCFGAVLISPLEGSEKSLATLH